MQVYIGIDWSEDKHDVVFMNQAGVDVARLTIPHSLDGFVQLEAALPYHEHSRQISHEIGDPFQKSHACHNLCTVNRKLGRLELAEQWGREALLLAQQNELADPQAYAWLHLGYVFRDRGKLSQAEQAFIRSRDGWLALERRSLAIEAVAGLAGTNRFTFLDHVPAHHELIQLWKAREG